MPDFDAKNIPVLDDVIENGDDKKREFDLSIESPDDEAKENNLDLFTEETSSLTVEDADINIEVPATETSIIETETLTVPDSIINFEYTFNPATETQIDTIENLSDEDNNEVSLYEPAKAAEDEAEKFESALIDYTAVDQAETPTISVPVIDDPTGDRPVENIQQPLTTISLQSVTDDIVKQLMPELEQQLRLLLEQALKEKLPEDSKHSDIPSASNPDN